MISNYLILFHKPFAALAASVVKRDAGAGADSGEQAGAAADDIDAGAAVTISVPAGTAQPERRRTLRRRLAEARG